MILWLDNFLESGKCFFLFFSCCVFSVVSVVCSENFWWCTLNLIYHATGTFMMVAPREMEEILWIVTKKKPHRNSENFCFVSTKTEQSFVVNFTERNPHLLLLLLLSHLFIVMEAKKVYPWTVQHLKTLRKSGQTGKDTNEMEESEMCTFTNIQKQNGIIVCSYAYLNMKPRTFYITIENHHHFCKYSNC